MPQLSVLMPVRNGAATVATAVHSTLRAMPKDAELVVWDDASTDATAELARSSGDHRVTVIQSAQSRGPGGAMQRLIDATDSEFIARMDADDVSLPWRFLVQLPAIRSGRCDYIFSPVVSFRTRPLHLRPELPLRIDPDVMPLHLAVTNLLAQPAMTATRAAITEVGGYRAMLAEDYDLWLRAAARGQRLARGGLPTVAYRHHAGQVSASAGFQAHIDSDTQLYDSYCDFFESVFGVTIRRERLPDGRFRRLTSDKVLELVDARAAGVHGVQRIVLDRTTRRLRAQ